MIPDTLTQIQLFEQMQKDLEKELEKEILNFDVEPEPLPELLATLEAQKQERLKDSISVGDIFGPWIVVNLHPDRTHRGEKRWITKHKSTGRLKIFLSKGLKELRKSRKELELDELE